jgi:hypothetical protein
LRRAAKQKTLYLTLSWLPRSGRDGGQPPTAGTPSVPRIWALEDVWVSEHIIVPRDTLRKVADEFEEEPLALS